jgi:phage terminase small subunit
MSDLNEIVPVENADARRELLSAQFDEVEAAAPEPERAQPAQAEKPRDEVGKFAKAAAAAPTEEKTEEDPVWRRPPASWKKDYHETWNLADDKLKQYAWQRESEMKAGVEPLISKAQFADQMQEVLNPYMNTIQGLGIDAPKAVKALMEADHALRYSNPQEKRQYFARLAQSYGVNLNDVGYDLPQQVNVDPTIYALQNELNNVRGEVQGWKQQQEQQQNQALLGEINNFSQKAEHFEEARPAMIQLLQSGMATDLDDAYEKAIRLSPELFDAVQSGRQAEADATKRAAANTAAKRARAAAVSVKGSTPGTVTNTKAQDRRSLLAEQFDNISDRL